MSSSLASSIAVKDHLSFTRPGEPFIRFYDERFKESLRLSNFHPCKLDYQKITFLCSEALYHCLRAPGFPHEIFSSLNGRAAWKAAQNMKKELLFAEDKYGIMEEIVMIKFSDPDLKEYLLSTRSSYLVERTKDKYWGDGLDGSGENNLGKILMIARENLGGEFGIVPRPVEYEQFLTRKKLAP